MNRDHLYLLREWVKAEVKAGIADSLPGSDGYYGTGYNENAEADKAFKELVIAFIGESNE